jgi:putative phage-type endonuclease
MQNVLQAIEKIDKTYYKQFTNSRKNNLYDSAFIYTLPEYKAYLLTHLSSLYEPKITNNVMDNYIKDKISKVYLPKIQPLLDSYSGIPYIEQKTEEWLEERRQIISASEAGYLLGVKGCCTIMNYLTNKLNIKNTLDKLCFQTSIQHGTIFEDVSRMIYESRNNVSVREYGLIKSNKTPILGASPDGIVSVGNTNNRIGRLVEIKNPYKYDDTDDIKPEYLIQIYQQQYVLGLPLCDFIKTNIVGANVNPETIANGYQPYKTLDQMLTDIPPPQTGSNIVLHNTNLPEKNLNSKGMEKGVLISYKSLTGEIKVVIYPINIEYNKITITNWINQQRTELINSGVNRDNIAVQYWYVAKYSEQTVEYDAELFEKNYLPRLELIWKIIDKLKTVQSTCDDKMFKIFLDTQVKSQLNKPSKFYKDNANFNAICKVLSDITKLEPTDANKTNGASNAVESNVVESNVVDNVKEKKLVKSKTKSKTKLCVEIELDF